MGYPQSSHFNDFVSRIFVYIRAATINVERIEPRAMVVYSPTRRLWGTVKCVAAMILYEAFLSTLKSGLIQKTDSTVKTKQHLESNFQAVDYEHYLEKVPRKWARREY